MSSLTQNIAWGLVVGLGLLVVLSGLGISITPMLTALGVGGLAVALALQEPLSNFFAGVFLALAGQIRVGDYVRLDSGQEGFVADFGWRSTRLRMLANNLVVVPNACTDRTPGPPTRSHPAYFSPTSLAIWTSFASSASRKSPRSATQAPKI